MTSSTTKKSLNISEIRDYILAVLAGFAGSFAFSPADQAYLIFLTLGVMFHFLYKRRHQTVKCWVLLASLCFFTVFWIHTSMTEYSDVPMLVAVPVLVAFAFYLSCYHALVIHLANRIFCGQMFIKNILAIPAGFILADYAVGHVLTGFPWVYIGYTQIDTIFRNLAPVAGVHAITLALLVISGLVYHSFYTRKLWYTAASLLVTVLISLCEHTYTEEGPKIQVALVQGNIQQQIKWDPSKAVDILDTYYDLSRSYFRGDSTTDLLIWPESALPELENNISELLFKLDELARMHGFAFITGVQTFQPSSNSYYNAVIGLGLQDPESDSSYIRLAGNRYYKRHLVPVGEMVPDFMRHFGTFFNMPMSSFSRGKSIQDNITAKGTRIATAICYEVAFPDEMQINVHDDTSLLLSVSNDGWFGTSNRETGDYHVSDGPYQHATIARMRTLEFQKPMIRTTNNGYTAIFDAEGRTQAALPFYQEGVLQDRVATRTGSTPFGTYGFTVVLSVVFGMLLIAFSHLLILMITTTRKKKNKSGS